MLAISITRPGPPEVLQPVTVDDPVPAAGEVLVRVAAAGINRADLLQRQGFYPPPPGTTEIPGLEVSGTIVDLGTDVTGWRPGDQVCALLAGGGYAELVCVPVGQLLRLPRGMDLVLGAAVPEVFVTAHDALFTRGRLERGETVLIHGGAGGIGTAAIQLAAQAGARVLVTAGGPERIERCRALGAEAGIDHREGRLEERVQELTEGSGVDVILDIMGASLLEANLACLALDGRMVVLGLQGGTRAECDLGLLLRRRASVIGTTLRARPLEQKAAIVAAAAAVMPGFEEGALQPVVARILPLREAAAAHAAMEAGGHVGKLLLRVEAPPG